MGRSRADPRPAATLGQSEIGARTAVHVAHAGRTQFAVVDSPLPTEVPAAN